MPAVRGEQSSPDDYFNDLSRRPSGGVDDPQDAEDGMYEDANGASVPKPKRMACVLCRRRKLRCGGEKPSCGTCSRLQHDCSYDEIRRKSGPKRGYVKALEARLAQVETLLKTQETSPATSGRQVHASHSDMPAPEHPNIAFSAENIDLIAFGEKAITSHSGPKQTPYPHAALGAAAAGNEGMTSEEPCPWEMIGLGLDEPLPSADAIVELTNTYFSKCHRALPMIHRPRFYAAMNLAPNMRPPICLRYAMWCIAAAVTDKYESFQEHFYQRARKYIQQDEMKGHGESMITIAHCQTWILLGAYEFKLMFFPRAWMSAGRACRLAQMMGLHRLDGLGLDVKQCLPPPRDWTEREERRRTFWGSFAVDRYSSIGTGWPMTIEERDIMTLMPCTDDAFELNRTEKTLTLNESLKPDGVQKLSSFGGVILMACLFGRNLTHLHRPGPDDNEGDLNGEFWKRHREMDFILLETTMTLPDALRLPAGLNDPNVVFMNMNVHTSTICLHQAAIFKADKNRLPSRVSAESKVRCITAAAEIASIMRQISHLDLSAVSPAAHQFRGTFTDLLLQMNPFISFCLYVAARVFVQYLKSRPNDSPVRSSLQFLLSAMHAIKRKNPLTESFIVQLDVDLESAGLENSDELRAAAVLNDDPSRNVTI
nr:tropolone cluster transcription factor tropk [Quercus suber]